MPMSSQLGCAAARRGVALAFAFAWRLTESPLRPIAHLRLFRVLMKMVLEPMRALNSCNSGVLREIRLQV